LHTQHIKKEFGVNVNIIEKEDKLLEETTSYLIEIIFYAR
jgi:hypothetical protein